MYSTISVIIPVRVNSGNLLVLQSVRNADYPKSNIEVIVASGEYPSIQRNRAADVSKGEILYFFNSDSQFGPEIFKRAIEIFRNDEMVAAVDGPDLTPESNNYIQHLFGCAMRSLFAHWKMRARYSVVGVEREAGEQELILSNMGIRRDVFVSLKGFSERFYPNEENELINRILKGSYKIIYSPNIKTYRDRRQTLNAFMHQFHSYGKGRMNQIFKDGVFGNIQFFMPVVLVIYLFSLIFLRHLPFVYVPFILYILLGLSDAMYISLKVRRNLIFILPAIYLIMHISYALGMLNKLFSNIFIRKKIAYGDVRIKHIKRFEDTM